MAREIEKKYFISTYPDLQGYDFEDIVQGYVKDKEHTLRIRKLTKKGQKSIYIQTIKQGNGLKKKELEHQLTKQQFDLLWKKAKYTLEKCRYLIPYQGYTIELDVYQGKLEGLVVAEIEFPSISAARSFLPPSWFGVELTGLRQATNHYLAKHGKKDLEQFLIYGPHHQTKQKLQEFYDHQAQKYASSRKKRRADAQHIVDTINSFPSQDIHILELGCGSSRTLEYLSQVTNKTIHYTGVDLSSKLLEFASQEAQKYPNIHTTFVCDDMVHYVTNLKQESFDIVLCIASFQHLPSEKERLLTLKHIYKLLTYDGILLMTNWAFSLWLFKHHFMSCIQAFGVWLLSFGKKDRRDIMISWKTTKETFYRYYHFFGLQELKNLCLLSGFLPHTLSYLDQQGQLLSSRKQSNNSLLIARKTISG